MKCYLSLLMIMLMAHHQLQAQGVWTQKANFPGTPRYLPAAFSIGELGYFATGWTTVGTNDLWEYNPVNNSWSQKATFPGTARGYAMGFAIGSKGYIGTGMDGSFNYYADFWEWDQNSNTWTQKANMGGMARLGAFAFAIGTKGYIGTGYDQTYYDDFWEWDQSSNTWTQKADFGGGLRSYAMGFSIGNKGYASTGAVGSLPVVQYNDFWEWDQSTNSWNQKATFPGVVRHGAVGYASGNRIYLGSGANDNNTLFYPDWWAWNQATDTWTQKANFAGTPRGFAACFAIGCKGYMGTGFDGSYFQDLWEFNPDTCTLTGLHDDIANSFLINISPNPCTDQFYVKTNLNQRANIMLFDKKGALVMQKDFTESLTVRANTLASGVYFYKVTSADGVVKNGKLVRE